MSTRRTNVPPALPAEDVRFPTLDDELEEAVELLPQQEPPETRPPPRHRRPGPSPTPDDLDPSMIDPAD